MALYGCFANAVARMVVRCFAPLRVKERLGADFRRQKNPPRSPLGKGGGTKSIGLS